MTQRAKNKGPRKKFSGPPSKPKRKPSKKRGSNDSPNRGPKPTNNKSANPDRRKRKRNVSSLNPADLVQQAEAIQPSTFEPSFQYQDSDLHPKVKENLARVGYTVPTEIQERSLKPHMEGRDILGIAKTGSGKTAAFLLPILHRQVEGRYASLVLAPTRELAVQIEEEYRSLSKGIKVYSACYIGGTNMNRDLQIAGKNTDLIVATPGRLLDLYQRGALHFKNIKCLVIDEFDRMLDMGFERDLNKIIDALPINRQNLLFSATLDPNQEVKIKALLQNPARLEVHSGNQSNAHIQQELVYVPAGESKMPILVDMLKQDDFDRVILFAETKRWVSKLKRKLSQAGIRADEIHGDKSQNYRQKALDKFKKGHIQVLVATDVAARGIDVDDVSHVINYQIPKSLDSYIHRVGRTGRAGKTGKAYTFIES